MEAGGEAGSEAGSEASACGTNPTACVNPSTGANDFCTSATDQCNACTDGTDDANCATAYGSGYICVGGACVTGNCHQDSDCMPTGEICGVETPNTCGTCTADPQCQTDPNYGTGYICNTSTGTSQGLCVTSTCTGSDTQCSANASDFCCPTSLAASTLACVSGTCCSDVVSLTQCPTGYTCTGNTCTQCAAATGSEYYVDPTNGIDSGHTGASNCPFKTLTKAFEFIGTVASTGTVVKLVNADPVGNAEVFPLAVPQGVTVEGAYTVSVAPGKVGFILDAPNSGLNGPTVDGATNTGLEGIAVYGGSSATTTVVQNVTVSNFEGPGIVVGKSNGKATTAGAVTLGPGLDVTGNGTTAKPEPGVLLAAGTATITGSAATGAGHTSIHANTQHGVLVDGTAYVNVNPGTTTAATGLGQAYVDVDNNAVAGLWISQSAAVTNASQNTVDFLEASGMGANGIHVNGGSFFTLRGSFVVGNHDSGVFIGAGAGTNADSLANIDLGDTTTDGQNTLQGPIGTSVLTNQAAGVCVGIPDPTGAAAGQTLLAVGNTWGVANTTTAIQCEKTATGGALTHTAACTNGVDLGGVGPTTTGTNSANISICTYQ
jgi:hypothetical protein